MYKMLIILDIKDGTLKIKKKYRFRTKISNIINESAVD